MPTEPDGVDPSKPKRLATMAVDDNMAYAACVLLSSLQHSARGSFAISLGFLSGSLSTENQSLIRCVCQSLNVYIEFEELEPDTRFVNQGHISATTFTKFQLSDRHTESHLWIDADTIALPGWDKLFEAIDHAPGQAGLVVAERGSVGAGASKNDCDPSLLPFNAGILGWPESTRRDWSSALDGLELVATQEQFLLNKLYATTALRVSEKFNMMTYRIDSLNPSDMPFIIHYAGAHKPWQLSPRFRSECLRHHCPWSEWYAAEEALFLRPEVSSLVPSLRQAARGALRTGSASTQRQHSGLRLVKTLNYLGPLGWLMVWVAKPLRSRIPRGTHPFH